MQDVSRRLTKQPELTLPPVRGSVAQQQRTRQSFISLGHWLGIILLTPAVAAAIAAPQLAPFDPFTSAGQPFQPPSAEFWMGTDDLGRDVFSAIIFGARTSLIVGFSVAMIALMVGVFIGLTSGFVGGWTDDALMRLTELFQIVPRFFLAIAVIALFGNSLLNLVLVLALTSWSGLARIGRAEVLSLRERDFVIAARCIGVKPSRIIQRHIFPNAIQPILAAAALIVSAAILTEAGLSFLGLGDPNTISWGYLLNNAQPFIRRAWWLPVFPGLAIVVTVLGLSLVLDNPNK